MANFYRMEKSKMDIGLYLESILKISNFPGIFDVALLHSLSALIERCLEFADGNAKKILTNDWFKDLSLNAIQELISRDTFYVPEIDIFRAACKWLTKNGIEDAQLILSKIRLPLMDASNWLEIFAHLQKTGWDLKLFGPVQSGDQKKQHRGFLVFDQNIITSARGAQIIEGTSKTFSFSLDSTISYTDLIGFIEHSIKKDHNGIVIDLGDNYSINHIKFLLWDRDTNRRSYSYHVEVSTDPNHHWERVVDYKDYFCRGWQKIYFPARIIRFIRIRGTRNTVNDYFHVVDLEASHVRSPPSLVNQGIIVPLENVATISNSAHVIEGEAGDTMINGDSETHNSTNCTSHRIGNGSIILQLSQPYAIDHIRLHLCETGNRYYKYFIETSLDKENWRLVVDKKKERSWQMLNFDSHAVSFIRIVGTSGMDSMYMFRVAHFECSNSRQKEVLIPATFFDQRGRVRNPVQSAA